MFSDIRSSIFNCFDRPEEYLINHYPQNYFDHIIDIGARGVSSPWHINIIAKDNPDTNAYAYEPDTEYYLELKNEQDNLNNLSVYQKGYSLSPHIGVPMGYEDKSDGSRVYEVGSVDTVSLSDIIDENNIDTNSRWAIKIDCEGCEYDLLQDWDDVQILKKATHISIEVHTTNAGVNFFTSINESKIQPTFYNSEKWLRDYFVNTHEGFLTSDDGGLRTYVFINKNVVEHKDELFWKNLLP